GYAGSVVINKRRSRQPVVGGIAGLFLLLALFGTSAEAQQRPVQRRPQPRADSLRDWLSPGPDSLRRAGQSLDTATAQRMGLPTAPSRSFAPADSVIDALMRRRGYEATRYRADSATVFVEDERVLLEGQALTERQGALLEADTITYMRDSC